MFLFLLSGESQSLLAKGVKPNSVDGSLSNVFYPQLFNRVSGLPLSNRLRVLPPPQKNRLAAVILYGGGGVHRIEAGKPCGIKVSHFLKNHIPSIIPSNVLGTRPCISVSYACALLDKQNISACPNMMAQGTGKTSAVGVIQAARCRYIRRFLK
ncbi:MAG: hypothetical protein Q9M30_05530 [Mariprofundaceae bacterium]|nr:hypothetical protein [Mariprofundaceae bacterium]